jgi:hypothetical protein
VFIHHLKDGIMRWCYWCLNVYPWLYSGNEEYRCDSLSSLANKHSLSKGCARTPYELIDFQNLELKKL